MPTRAVKKKSACNAIGDPTQSLQTFNLLDLQQFVLEKSYSPSASKDFSIFSMWDGMTYTTF